MTTAYFDQRYQELTRTRAEAEARGWEYVLKVATRDLKDAQTLAQLRANLEAARREAGLTEREVSA